MALTIEQILKLGDLSAYYTPQIQKFTIDGNDIECYSTYSYFDAKSYVKSPERSSSGAISNLNSYATFLTPRLRINFSMMSIDTYRVIMKLIQSKNEFVVTCYDPVWNKMKTFKAYFSTEDYPELYIYDLHTLGVIGYEIELQGTNNELDLVSVTYHLNPPPATGASDAHIADNDVSKGQEILIGSGCDYQQETFSGAYKFKHWTENSDGSGFVYVDDKAYTINENLVLYAKWE